MLVRRADQKQLGVGMIGMVLVTHGRLADELIAALEHVVGPQKNVLSVCIGPDDDMEQRRSDIMQSVMHPTCSQAR